MTKEEARLTLQENFGYLSDEHPRIIEAMKVAMNILSQPSLPSNLDEAAEVYAKSRVKDPELCYEYLYYEIQEAVRFGAEWMAGQGVILEGHVCKDDYATEAPFYYVETENSDDLPIVGAKVVVQIRKK